MTECNENENNTLLCGQYRILAEIGKSAAGIVYKCLDENTGSIVALKQLPPQVASNEEEMQTISENIHSYYRLNHQNIAACHALINDPDNGNYYFVTDYIDGINLLEWVRKNREGSTVPQHTVIPILKQLADALDYAHSQQIVHRDLKPENIMIQADGTVRILDFGLSAQVRDCLARLNVLSDLESRGNGPYVAPEQWREGKLYANSDQYALGILLYELFAGELPYKCTRQTSPAILKELTITEEPEPIDAVTRQVWDVLVRALKKDPASRYPTCKNIAFALEQLIKPPQVELTEDTASVQKKSGSGGLWLLALLFGICGGAAGYFFLGMIGGIVGFIAGFLLGCIIKFFKG